MAARVGSYLKRRRELKGDVAALKNQGLVRRVPVFAGVKKLNQVKEAEVGFIRSKNSLMNHLIMTPINPNLKKDAVNWLNRFGNRGVKLMPNEIRKELMKVRFQEWGMGVGTSRMYTQRLNVGPHYFEEEKILRFKEEILKNRLWLK